MRFFGTHVCVRLTPHFRRVVRESPRVVALVLYLICIRVRSNFYFEVMVTCVRVACFAVTNLRIAVRCKFNFWHLNVTGPHCGRNAVREAAVKNASALN